MKREKFIRDYWRYYFMLEEDFMKTIRFVELNSINYNTFSVEYTKQYQSICSEIDVICKAICKLIDPLKPEKDISNIIQYAGIILGDNDIITKRVVLVEENEYIELTPFVEWTLMPEYKSPSWWEKYNNIKHNRVEKFESANLENVINALAGLFLLEMYLLERICEMDSDKTQYNIPDEPSRLFKIKDWESNVNDIHINYVLNGLKEKQEELKQKRVDKLKK